MNDGQVNWLGHNVDHMADRHEITPTQAQEALDDIDAVWIDPDPTSKSGISIRVVGYCHTRSEILCVTLIPVEDGREGWDGVNAWPANPTFRRIYREGKS